VSAAVKRPWVRRPRPWHVERYGEKAAKWVREAEHVASVLGLCSAPELRRLGALIDAWNLHYHRSRVDDVDELLGEVNRYIREHAEWHKDWVRRSRAGRVRRDGNVVDITRCLPRRQGKRA
jgi:hypothetical protein